MLPKDSLLQAASELAVYVCLIRAWIPHLLDCRGAEDMFQFVTKVWCPLLSLTTKSPRKGRIAAGSLKCGFLPVNGEGEGFYGIPHVSSPSSFTSVPLPCPHAQMAPVVAGIR